MANSAVPSNPSVHHVASLLPKLNNVDPDIRYMSLNDLNGLLIAGHPTFLIHDYTTCARVIEGLLHTLNDQNGDVQNMAIKCLGPFVNRAPDQILCPLFDKISNLRTDNAIDSSITALAVRAVVVALPRPIPGTQRSPRVLEAYSAVSRALIPRLVGYIVLPPSGKALPAPPKGMLQVELETGQDGNALDVLTEVARCFGNMLQEPEVRALQKIAMDILESSKCGNALKKKAVNALSILAIYFTDALLSSFISYTIEHLRQPHLVNSQRKLYISIYGSMARSVPRKFGPYLKQITPFVIAPLSQMELDQQNEEAAEMDEGRDPQVEEVRETSLVALDAFISSSSDDMRQSMGETIDAALRFLKYDPNYADDDETMDDDDDFEAEAGSDDEDFEEETGFDDEDDVSWKVRRSAAKLLHTVCGLSNTLDDGVRVLYNKVAPALISRFGEREESVRLEVLATSTYLIRQTNDRPSRSLSDDNLIIPSATQGSRKRRRGSSSVGVPDRHGKLAVANGYTSPSTPPPQTGPEQSLAKLGPEIVKGVSRLLKTGPPATKQAAIVLLTQLVVSRHGGLSDGADQVVGPVVEAMKSTAGGVTSSTANQHSLRIEALRLLRVLAETHSSKVVEPYLDKIIPSLTQMAQEKFTRVASEAFETIEVYIKALTPPRSTGSGQQYAAYIEELYRVINSRATASDTDTEIRQKTIQAMGVLLGRTSGPRGSSLLSENSRRAGFQLIDERLRNELTRTASVRAIEVIAVLVQDKTELKPDWTRSVALELGAQLRKSSRSLRGASLSALRMLSTNPACRENFDDDTIAKTVDMLLPLINDVDLHMLGPALLIIGAFAKYRPQVVLTPNVVSGICSVTKMDLHGAVLDALLVSVETCGQQGQGKDLMTALLKDVGIAGNQEVVGQVIGTLLVAGSGNVGVSLNDFKTELSTTQDDKRKCLALYILGEVGLRLGQSCPLTPEDFSGHFKSSSEKVRLAAAIALGRAGAGNVKDYLPQVLAGMASGENYLLLHTVKEMLQHSTAEADIVAHSKQLWEHIIAASQTEDNKAVGSECIGRLAIIDPASYLPQLQTYLSDPQPAVRGMVISALRFTFADTDTTYGSHLQPIIVSLLTTMLNETDLENRRLALTTFNSAAHNKPDLIMPQLGDLLPLAIKETVIRPELVREVTMGPFKHKVDDGLELRKSAYETLYALIETAFSRIPVSSLYERVIAGIADDHNVKILCCLMLSKLLVLAPEETSRCLDGLAEAFRPILAFKPKDNAVKQELEKLGEHNKAIVKVTIQINKALPNETQADAARTWRDYWDWVRRDHVHLVKAAEDELKEKDR